MQCSLDRDKPHALEPHMDRINNIFSGETLEKIYDNLRQDGSEWSKTQLETLSKMARFYCVTIEPLIEALPGLILVHLSISPMVLIVKMAAE